MFHALACLGVLLAPTAAAPQQQSALPTEIVRYLDREYRGWRVAPLPRELEGTPRGSDANVLRRDFDGDGTIDVVVLIEYARGAGPVQVLRRGIVLLRGRAPQALTGEVPVEELGPYISLAAKGERTYDLDQDRYFTLERDAIHVGFDGRGPCFTFVFRAGRFESVWTCD